MFGTIVVLRAAEGMNTLLETVVKKIALMLALFVLTVAFVGCKDTITASNPVPQPPQGVYTITGDSSVTINWSGVYSDKVVEYVIYRSLTLHGNYVEVGRRTAESNPGLDLVYYAPGYVDHHLTNGTTYYYRVTTVDNDGRESDMSAEAASDTPRPQGTTTLFLSNIAPTLSGFNFETGSRVDSGSTIADIYIDSSGGTYYLNIGNRDTYLMDMGYTSNFDEISYSPLTNVPSGWSELAWMELIVGHTYVVRTSVNHFAKLRVVRFNQSGSVDFEWAWQTAAGNPELVPAFQGKTRTGETNVTKQSAQSAPSVR